MNKLKSWLTETHNDPYYDGLDLQDLDIDEYYIKFTYPNYKNIYLYNKYRDCYKCPYFFSRAINPSNGSYIKMKSKPEEWRLLSKMTSLISYPSSNDDVICTFPDFQMDREEFGVYASEELCQIKVLKDPVNIYSGIFTVLLLTVFFVLFGYTMKFVYSKLKKLIKRRNGGSDNTEETQTKKSSRVQSLDTFRGISIVIMIFVNYGAGQYEFLEHATWNGLNVADLVFPWFMWIMGVCIPISVKSALKRSSNRGVIFLNIFRRSVVLFLLGIFLNQGIKLDEIRIFGVLQRFSLCYLVVASINLFLTGNTNSNIAERPKYIQFIYDIYSLIPQWILVLIIMTIHLTITFLLEVPDCPSGYLGPGGLHEGGLNWNCTGGATGYIDREVLGIKHLYQHPTATIIYKSRAFDPEGLFGTLNSIVQVFIGVQAGTTLLMYKSHRARLARWLCWAIVTGLVGGALCGFSKEDGVIPVNKNLWSLSFVLVTSCFAFILLSFCYVLIDICKLWSGKPFLYAGMNATIMYVGHSMTYAFPFHWALNPMNTHYLYLARAVWGTCLWIIIAYKLYLNKFFLSI